MDGGMSAALPQQNIVQTKDPRSGRIVGTAKVTSANVTAEQLQAAAQAHRREALADPAKRASLLRACADRLQQSEGKLIDRATRETGLTVMRLETELVRAVGQLRAFAELVSAGDVAEPMIDRGNHWAAPPQHELRRMNVPIGPVLVFTASNFPFAFGSAGGDVAAALAAGCPVIVKDHPLHATTAELTSTCLVETALEYGLDGVFGHVLAVDADEIARLVEAPELAAVAFTGSFVVGERLATICASRRPPIPLFAEMGSVNPLIVSTAAAARRGPAIAEGLASSLLSSAGQLCTKSGLVLTPSSAAGEQMVALVSARLLAWPPEPLLGDRLRSQLRSGVESIRALEGVRVEGKDVPADGATSPFVLVRTDVRHVVAQEGLRRELFGPAVVVAGYEDEDEVLDALETLEGQLTVTLHAEPEERELARRLIGCAQRLAGRIVFNGYPTGVRVAYGTVHGGPWPATTAPSHTSVGMTAVRRFCRPVVFQDAPAELLPPELADDNPLGILRLIDGRPSQERVTSPTRWPIAP
jgi:acyl-CoA reductase-like NAD-dependent aldehyde dehydrogenase